jgi:hypothetical protein
MNPNSQGNREFAPPLVSALLKGSMKQSFRLRPRAGNLTRCKVMNRQRRLGASASTLGYSQFVNQIDERAQS